MLLTADLSAAQDIGPVERANAGRVAVLTSGLSDYAGGQAVADLQFDMIRDLARAIDTPGAVRVVPTLGYGGVQNLRDLLLLRGIDMAVVNADTLPFVRRETGLARAVTDTRLVTPLYTVGVLIIAREGITDIASLAGKRFATPGEGSPMHVSAANVLSLLGIDVTFVHGAALPIETGAAVRAVADGQRPASNEAEAGDAPDAFALLGPPVALEHALARLPAGYAALNVPRDQELLKLYEPVDFSSAPGVVVEGVQTYASLITYNWREGAQARYAPLRAFVSALFASTDKLRAPARHWAWRSFDPDHFVSVWDRHDLVETALAETRGARRGVDRAVPNFVAFKAPQDLGGPATVRSKAVVVASAEAAADFDASAATAPTADNAPRLTGPALRQVTPSPSRVAGQASTRVAAAARDATTPRPEPAPSSSVSSTVAPTDVARADTGTLSSTGTPSRTGSSTDTGTTIPQVIARRAPDAPRRSSPSQAAAPQQPNTPPMRIAGLTVPSFAGAQLPAGGVAMELLRTALATAPDRQTTTAGGDIATTRNARAVEVAWFNGLTAQLIDRLSDARHDIIAPVERPDCSRPSELTLELALACDSLDFSDVIVQQLIVFFARNDGDLAPSQPGNLEGRRICVASNASIAPLWGFLRANENNREKVSVARLVTVDACMNALANGEVDLVMANDRAGLAIMARLGLENRISMLTTPVGSTTLHAAVLRGELSSADRLAALNAAIGALRSDKRYAEIVQRQLLPPALGQ
ncbi:MAG: transporter substrate-binding domain-containing protein [Pseudomonadota bacterium]